MLLLIEQSHHLGFQVRHVVIIPAQRVLTQLLNLTPVSAPQLFDGKLRLEQLLTQRAVLCPVLTFALQRTMLLQASGYTCLQNEYILPAVGHFPDLRL